LGALGGAKPEKRRLGVEHHRPSTRVSRRAFVAGTAGAAAGLPFVAVRRGARAQDATAAGGATPVAAATPATPGAFATPVAATRELPAWFADAKLGIFVHWGLYSVPGWAPTTGPLNEVIANEGWPGWFRRNPYAEWYWNSLRVPGSPTADYHRTTYGANTPYDAFVPRFDAANAGWDPATWAALFREVGAGYVVLTTKHHDGFRLWPSADPNPVKGPYHAARDLVGDLTGAVRAAGLRMGLYYSGGLDWAFNPAVITDLPELFAAVPQDPAYVAYADRQWRELIARYRPDVLWNDLGHPQASDVAALIADYYAAVPDGVVNDRFKLNPDLSPGAPADFRTAEYSPDQELSAAPYEATRGIGFSFGYNRNESEETFISVPDLIRFFVDTVSKNGNLLLNVGPTAAGEIPPGQRARLEGLGAWLRLNGEAIFGTRPWHVAEGTAGDGTPLRFTRKEDALYALLLGQPADGALALPGLRAAPGTTVRLLGRDEPVAWSQVGDAVELSLPGGLPDSPAHALAFSPVPEGGG
jgi:alpha-L-fucosidase